MCGASKVWAQLNRQGTPVARCTVQRLMRNAGLCGVTRGRRKIRTTLTGTGTDYPVDLVKRNFTASAPDRLWVADLTYIRTRAGWVYAAFIIDAYSKYIVGWQTATTLRSSLAIDALEMALATRRRRNHERLVHHSDRGGQPRFKGSSQHCLVWQSVGVRRGSRRGSSNRGFYGVDCSELRRQRPGRPGSVC